MVTYMLLLFRFSATNLIERQDAGHCLRGHVSGAPLKADLFLGRLGPRSS